MLKHCYLILLITTFFYLRYTEIGVGNKIIYTYFGWINETIEPISEDEVNMTNVLIKLKIEVISNQKQYDELINKNSSSLTELRLDRKSIQS